MKSVAVTIMSFRREVIGNPEQRSWHSLCGAWIHDRQTPRLVCACKEATNVELLLQSGVGVAESPLGGQKPSNGDRSRQSMSRVSSVRFSPLAQRFGGCVMAPRRNWPLISEK